jgi:hypothetical protein
MYSKRLSKKRLSKKQLSKKRMSKKRMSKQLKRRKINGGSTEPTLIRYKPNTNITKRIIAQYKKEWMKRERERERAAIIIQQAYRQSQARKKAKASAAQKKRITNTLNKGRQYIRAHGDGPRGPEGPGTGWV